MVSISKRKIVRTGTSKTVTLPKDWLEGMKIDVGNEVEVFYDSVVLIKPHDLDIDEYSLLRQFRGLVSRGESNNG